MYKWSRLHDQNGRHAHTYMVNLKKNLLLENQRSFDLDTWRAAFGNTIIKSFNG